MDKDLLTGLIVIGVILVCIIALIVILVKKIIQKIRGNNTNSEKKPHKKERMVKESKRKKKDKQQKSVSAKAVAHIPNSKSIGVQEEVSPDMIKTPINEEEDDDETTVLMRPAQRIPRIQLISDTTGQVYSSVCEKQIAVGRKNSCEIVITGDKAVSGIHCIIQVMDDGTFSVRDNNSSNGTYLNDRKVVGNEYITTGDTLEIGRNRYKVTID